MRISYRLLIRVDKEDNTPRLFAIQRSIAIRQSIAKVIIYTLILLGILLLWRDERNRDKNMQEVVNFQESRPEKTSDTLVDFSAFWQIVKEAGNAQLGKMDDWNDTITADLAWHEFTDVLTMNGYNATKDSYVQWPPGGRKDYHFCLRFFKDDIQHNGDSIRRVAREYGRLFCKLFTNAHNIGDSVHMAVRDINGDQDCFNEYVPVTPNNYSNADKLRFIKKALGCDVRVKDSSFFITKQTHFISNVLFYDFAKKYKETISKVVYYATGGKYITTTVLFTNTTEDGQKQGYVCCFVKGKLQMFCDREAARLLKII